MMIKRNFFQFISAYSLSWTIFIWLLLYALPSVLIDNFTYASGTFVLSIIAYNSFYPAKRYFFDRKISPRHKAVLITGCDSGFGHELAKRLDTIGYQVFASCLFPSQDGAKSLKTSCSDRLKILGLDVTNEESIKNAVAFVKENLGSSELWAVVNNAGVLKGFHVSWTDMKNFRQCFDINSFGPLMVTQAFLPLLRYAKGRVITIISVAGRVAFPHIAPYTISKHAVSGFCDSLRWELQPWGVRVISIEPEIFQTSMTNVDIIEAGCDQTIRDVDEKTLDEFGEEYFREFLFQMRRCFGCGSTKVYKVLDALEDAISLEEPDDVYRPCRNVAFSLMFKILTNTPLPILKLLFQVMHKFIGFPVPVQA